MSDNPQRKLVDSIRDLSRLEFAPGSDHDAIRKVGQIARGLLYLAGDHASNWELNEVIDGGGVHYWEVHGGRLEAYSTNSVGFSVGRDIVSKAVFDDHGDEISALLSIGNVDRKTRAAAEYSGAILMPTENGVAILTKKLHGISWTEVLHATITPDNSVTVVESD